MKSILQGLLQGKAISVFPTYIADPLFKITGKRRVRHVWDCETFVECWLQHSSELGNPVQLFQCYSLSLLVKELALASQGAQLSSICQVAA